MRKLLAVAVTVAALMSIQFTSASAAPTSGSLDRTFAGDGIASLKQSAYAVAIQPDGKIVVAGGAVDRRGRDLFALARFDRDGTLDRSFSGDGLVRTRFAGSAGSEAVAIQPNGRIVVGGTAETRNNKTAYAFARYLPDGSLDTSFSGDGKLVAFKVGSMNVSDISGVALGADNTIVASAYVDDGRRYVFGVLRLTRRGLPDTSFSEDGVAVSRFGRHAALAEAIAIQPDGAIVAAGGLFAGRFVVARFLPDGTHDLSFSGDGKRTLGFGGAGSWAAAVALQDDGKIVVAGTVRYGPPNAYGRLSIALARVNTDGTLDPSFAGDGRRITTGDGNLRGSSVGVQTDGKIVVGGEATPTIDEYPTNFGIATYTTDGGLDPSFAGDGISVKSFQLDDRIEAIALQPNGKIVAVGASQGRRPTGYAIARFLP